MTRSRLIRSNQAADGDDTATRREKAVQAALEEAAAVVQEVAAVVEETAAVVDAAARMWPHVERRRLPRLNPFRRHEARVEWKHIAFYIPVLLAVIVAGVAAIWWFFERQSMAIEPAPLPKITLITADASSPLTASWIRLLSDAAMQPTLVEIGGQAPSPTGGVLVFCGVTAVPPALQKSVDQFVARGGAVAIAGAPPSAPIGGLQLTSQTGMSDQTFQFSEAASPILARLNPGSEIQVRPSPVAFLKESPQMIVDARWRTNARAVIMHMERQGNRFLWLGFDPGALPVQPHADPQLTLLLRTAFRWASGQPISDGAAGGVPEVESFAPEARRAARAAGLAYGVDRLGNRASFAVRLANRGGRPIENPTVKIWLPPGVIEVALAGDMIMRRNATLIGIPEEGACLVRLAALTRNEDRVLKLKIVEVRPRAPTNR